MHERGYTFIGDTRISALTLPEMRKLHTGFCVEQQKQYDEKHGISSEEREGFDEFVEKLDEKKAAEAGIDSHETGSRSRQKTVPGSSRVNPPGVGGSSNRGSSRVPRQRRR